MIKLHIFVFFIVISLNAYLALLIRSSVIIDRVLIGNRFSSLFHGIAATGHARREGSVEFVAGAIVIIDLFAFPLLTSLFFTIPLTRSSHAANQGPAGATNQASSERAFSTGGQAADNGPAGGTSHPGFTGTPYFLLFGWRR
jgi:hypothetical protein